MCKEEMRKLGRTRDTLTAAASAIAHMNTLHNEVSKLADGIHSFALHLSLDLSERPAADQLAELRGVLSHYQALDLMFNDGDDAIAAMDKVKTLRSAIDFFKSSNVLDSAVFLMRAVSILKPLVLELCEEISNGREERCALFAKAAFNVPEYARPQ